MCVFWAQRIFHLLLLGRFGLAFGAFFLWAFCLGWGYFLCVVNRSILALIKEPRALYTLFATAFLVGIAPASGALAASMSGMLLRVVMDGSGAQVLGPILRARTD